MRCITPASFHWSGFYSYRCFPSVYFGPLARVADENEGGPAVGVCVGCGEPKKEAPRGRELRSFGERKTIALVSAKRE